MQPSKTNWLLLLTERRRRGIVLRLLSSEVSSESRPYRLPALRVGFLTLPAEMLGHATVLNVNLPSCTPAHAPQEGNKAWRPHAIVVSVMILVWCVGFVHKKNGSLVFLLLSILLFLVGGGVAQVVFLALAWAASTRINRPVTWLRVVFPESVCGALARLWLWLLTVFTVLALIALEIAIGGYVPWVSDPKLALHICWSILAVSLGILLAACVCGFAHDLASSPTATTCSWGNSAATEATSGSSPEQIHSPGHPPKATCSRFTPP